MVVGAARSAIRDRKLDRCWAREADHNLYGELFKKMAGVDLVTVHYRGSGPALPDVISGRVQVIFDLTASSIGYIKEGKFGHWA